MYLEGSFLSKSKAALELEIADRGSTTPLKPALKKAPTPPELTLSYLCENLNRSAADTPKPEPGRSGKNLLGGLGFSEKTNNEEARWSERDFLHLTESGSRSKRPAADGEDGGDDRGKKPKVETLDLGLSLGSSPKRTQSMNTRASSDNCAASRSLSYYSNPFSHNPSCSMTRNSTENLDFSRENDQIWCAGEGTNGSVHSRFKPIGLEGSAGNINFSSPLSLLRHQINGKEPAQIQNQSQHQNSSNSSFFPSELPARPVQANSDGLLKNSTIQSHGAILKQLVLESVPAVAQKFNEIQAEDIEAIRGHLKYTFSAPEKKEELASMRRKLERRSDLSPEVLSKANRFQLEAMVALRFNQSVFLSGKTLLPISELVEIFLQTRCKNINCRNVLPVDECDCKICSTKKGFCSACTCPVCLRFDSAQNTCSWVGCDVCLHWCHAACGLRKNLIRPGGERGKTEMQFYCVGCGHASEMYGFVKEVFVSFAKDWGVETLTKELDCVAKIFKGSEDFRGKEVNSKAEELLRLLEKKVISPSDACAAMVQLLMCGPSEQLRSGSQVSSKNKGIAPWIKTEEVNGNASVSGGVSLQPKKAETAIVAVSEPSSKAGFESLESIVRFKVAEAELFQRLAVEARREVEGYVRIARSKSQKLEEEYAAKLVKIGLQEAEERRRKKVEELKKLENSHYDYHNMKMRMQAEIAGLLERMEATKRQWVGV